MVEKIKKWIRDKEDEIDFWCVMIVLSAIAYVFVWCTNWLLVGFLSFTGLKWIVITVIATAATRLAFLMYDSDFGPHDKEEGDEHKFL